MIDFKSVRNTLAESPSVSVQITADRCASLGITPEYAGLTGIVIMAEGGECLVQLSKESHKRYTEIETKVFSEGLRDLSENQWFASGLLEVVQPNQESEKDNGSSWI